MSDALVPLDTLDSISPGRARALVAAVKLLFGLHNPILDPKIERVARSLFEDITVENASRLLPQLLSTVVRENDWRSEPPHLHPTPLDVLSRVHDYAEAEQNAGDHGKRKILWNAFFSSFKPQFYKDGMAKHLWRISKDLEYPDARMLVKLIERPRRRDSPQDYGSLDEWLRGRLQAAGLLLQAKGSQEASVTEIGHKLKEFVWDTELGNLESTPSSGGDAARS